MSFLSGYKTIIAGVGLILQALVGAAMHFADPTSPMAMDLGSALALFCNGLGFLGVKFALLKAFTEKK